MACRSVSLLLLTDKLLDAVLTSLKLKRDFLIWCFERLKTKSSEGARPWLKY
ncbi:hypothetical protein HYPP_03809 [Hyphomicrobium sp. ghe19]|nr:hypothetical protein HYPP_03809 [Hyphomicrobium sp. ghe19]